MNENHNMVWMWLLIGLATTFSIFNLYLFYKLLKKVDDTTIVTGEAIDLISSRINTNTKDIEILNRNVRIVNNEVKENIQSIRKTKAKV